MVQNEFITSEKPITEGKTKKIFSLMHYPNSVIMEAKDATTADNDADKTRNIAAKGVCATRTTSRVFELLQEAGIPIAYVRQLSETEILSKKCDMIPLEVIARRYAVGSYLDRMPELKREDTPYRFQHLKYELFLKTSKGKLNDFDLRDYLPETKEALIPYLDVAKTLKKFQEKNKQLTDLLQLDYETLREEVIKIIDDPWISDPGILEAWPLRHPKKPIEEIPDVLARFDGSNIVDDAMLHTIEELTRKTFLVLEGAWENLGYRLIDFKIEFGLDCEGNLIVADVIDNDSWRLRTPDWKEISKQTFRDNDPLKDVQENYVHVATMVESFSANDAIAYMTKQYAIEQFGH